MSINEDDNKFEVHESMKMETNSEEIHGNEIEPAEHQKTKTRSKTKTKVVGKRIDPITKETVQTLFTCAYCSIDNDYYKHCQKLLNDESGENIYYCQYCGLKVTSAKIRKKEFQFEILNCKHCDFKCTNPSKLDAHVNSHLREYDYQCSICGVKFEELLQMKRHALTHRSEGYKCQFCNVETRDKRTLANHVNGKHTHEICYQCDICGFKTYWPTTLTRHKSKHVKPSLVKKRKLNHLKCIYCPYEALSNNAMSRHVNDHLKKSFQCKFCKFKTRYENQLNTHIERIHKTQKVFKCKLCNFKASISSHLAKHYSVDHYGKIYKCNECDYSSWQLCTLKRHEQGKHQKSLLSCPHCNLQFKWQRALDLHVSVIHQNECRFFCKKCDFKTPYSNTLINHVNIKHNKGDIFSCKLCNYKSVSKIYLAKHVEGKHGENKRYSCQFCDFKSSYHNALNEHINSKHIRQRIFPCNLCDFKTTYKSNLKSHIKVKHENVKRLKQ